MAQQNPLAELDAQRIEPDPKVLKALVKFVENSPMLPVKGEIEGLVRGFLMDHPAIAKADTARKMLERVAIGFTGFIEDVATYLLTTEKPKKGAPR